MSEASNDVMQLGNAYRGPVRSIGTNMNALPDGTPVVNYYGQGYITREQNPQYFDSIYGREPSQGGLLGAMDMKDIATAASMFAAAYGGGQLLGGDASWMNGIGGAEGIGGAGTGMEAALGGAGAGAGDYSWMNNLGGAEGIGGPGSSTINFSGGMPNFNWMNNLGGPEGVGGPGSTTTPAPGAGAVTQAATGTALSRIMNGTATDADYLSVLGTVGSTALGMYGASQQGNALRDIASQARSDRQPFLGKALEWMNDPAAYASGPGQTSMNAVLRQLSASGGNPIGNPTSLGLATEAGLRDWRNAVTGMANIGLSGQDSRNSLLASAAGADSGIYNALGSGLANVTNPPKSLADVLKELKGIPGMSSLTTLA